MGCMKWCAVLAVFLVCLLPLYNGNKVNEPMVINSLRVDCKITSRFARTFITTDVYNQLNVSREAVFDVELPKTAFITNFNMTVDGVTNVGEVKEKAQAEQKYQTAVSRGQSAGLVQSTGRKMEHFKISVNVAGFSQATFKLTYEELLKRHLGKYEFNLRIKPKQLVERFEINADIVEPQGISFLNVDANFITNDLKDVVDVTRTKTKAHITFKPSLDQQRRCPSCQETLLDGDFVIKYDVDRENSAGDIQIVNGYFVHYFAPTSLQKLPKNVVFVIDRSWSMYGHKMKQTYEAFLKILDDMPVEDHFGIITFDSIIEHWRKTMVKADPTNIAEAKRFVAGIDARGMTDINNALIQAGLMLKKATDEKILPEISTSLILFLSDGDPTIGVIDRSKIMNNVKKSIGGKATLYCLGFGHDLDYNFLEKLSQENGGLARRIYEDSDSALQLQGFYHEVAYPMLLNVEIKYSENSVEYLTQNTFRHYYQGSEIIVAGYIGNNDLQILTAQVTGQGTSEQFSVNLDAKVTEVNETIEEQGYIFFAFTERLWAYLTLEQLLTNLASAEGEEKTRLTKKALDLSLKYSFVTPLTSMVVTNPEDEDKKLVANKPKEGAHTIPAHTIPARTIPARTIPARTIPDVGYSDVGYSDLIAEAEDSGLDSDEWTITPAQCCNDYQTQTRRSPIRGRPIQFPKTTTSTTTHTSVEDCIDNFVLLRVPTSQKYVCLRFDADQKITINLLRDASAGFTFNGKLNGNKVNFDRFGLIKNKLKVEITAEEINLVRGKIVTNYEWKTPFRKHGFLKNEGNKLTITLANDTTIIVTPLNNPSVLGLFVEHQHSVSSGVTGLFGVLINDFISSNSRDTIKKTLGQKRYNCNFTPFGLEADGSCQTITVNPAELINGHSNVVSDIFVVPH